MLANLDRTIAAEVREGVGLLLETGNLPDELGNHDQVVGWKVIMISLPNNLWVS